VPSPSGLKVKSDRFWVSSSVVVLTVSWEPVDEGGELNGFWCIRCCNISFLSLEICRVLAAAWLLRLVLLMSMAGLPERVKLGAVQRSKRGKTVGATDNQVERCCLDSTRQKKTK
jgi:hypothetical protein